MVCWMRPPTARSMWVLEQEDKGQSSSHLVVGDVRDSRVEQGAEDDRVEVDRLNVVGQERALDTQHVPPAHLGGGRW